MSIKGQGTGEKEGTWRQEWLDQKNNSEETPGLERLTACRNTTISVQPGEGQLSR